MEEIRSFSLQQSYLGRTKMSDPSYDRLVQPKQSHPTLNLKNLQRPTHPNPDASYEYEDDPDPSSGIPSTSRKPCHDHLHGKCNGGCGYSHLDQDMEQYFADQLWQLYHSPYGGYDNFMAVLPQIDDQFLPESASLSFQRDSDQESN